MRNPDPIEIPALEVHQWIDEWDAVKFSAKEHRTKPPKSFYLFSVSARRLKALTGIQRRTTAGGKKRSEDPGIQRRHEPARSREIGEYVSFGFPWSELSVAKRQSGDYDDLRKPGWLPTAIVVNILTGKDKRSGKPVADADLVRLKTRGERVSLDVPGGVEKRSWKPQGIHPIEVIDGQHRLWAFEDSPIDEEFELPVVAFYGLDISWQAYLFWTINIRPKRINQSLAFDLYPLLRTEDWLERFEGHSIYRETRSQELVEALWSHPKSPWRGRINMLGEPGLKQRMVTQAAWIRSLMASYVKSWEGRGVRVGGLFGTVVGETGQVLPWTRAQQAAYLIMMGYLMQQAVSECDEFWATELRREQVEDEGQHEDFAFGGPHTLLNADQGIRALLHVTNDLSFVAADELRLDEWESGKDAGAADEEAVSEALKELSRTTAAKFLRALTKRLSTYDWRSSSADGLTDDDRLAKAAFRGSGGYKELRRHLLLHLTEGNSQMSQFADKVLERLRY